MIRVNLLGVPREAVREMAGPAEAAGAADRDALLKKLQAPIAGVLLLGGAAYLGIGYVKNNGEIDRIQREIKAENERKARLAEIQKKIDGFEAKKAELTNKIGVINSLKDNQQTPMYIMDEVSRRLDDHVWIQAMALKGNLLEIKGSAFTLTAMTNFMRNMGESPYVATYELKRAADQRGVYGFDLICRLKAVRPERLAAGAPPPAPEPAKAPARRR